MAEDQITTIEECYDKELIVELERNSEGEKTIFAYPKKCLRNNEWVDINGEQAFPYNGAIVIRTEHPDDLIKQYGQKAAMVLRKESIVDNEPYYVKETGSKYYTPNSHDILFLMPFLDEQSLVEKVNDLKDELQSEAGSQTIDALVMKEIIRAFSESEEDKKPTPRNPGETDAFDEGKLSEIIEAIQGERPQLKPNDIINYMICLTQGYITTFAGKPGTGKTSLCDILAGTLGLKAKNNEGFIKINVENGWTSYKDYIGYYNPLAKSVEPADMDTFNAMHTLSVENDGEDYPPYIFLLDEANLSPIEYYWSPFLQAAGDLDDRKAKLSLGGPVTWDIPEHVRFLATVNFDHTTEELSPRFLDRSWVITLDSRDAGDKDQALLELRNADKSNDSENEKETSPATVFSYSDLNKVFGPRDNETLEDLESKEDSRYKKNKQVLDDLKKICTDNGFEISPRSYRMMLEYIATASTLMDDEYAPVDYAFSQKVLPQINGPEEPAGKLIEELLGDSMIEDLPKTKHRLEHMKKTGGSRAFYQYFA